MTGEKLAWGGLAAGAGILGAVGVLLARTLAPTREIVRYAEDIAATVDAIAGNVGGGAELMDTCELAQAVPGLVDRLTGARA